MFFHRTEKESGRDVGFDRFSAPTGVVCFVIRAFRTRTGGHWARLFMRRRGKEGPERAGCIGVGVVGKLRRLSKKSVFSTYVRVHVHVCVCALSGREVSFSFVGVILAWMQHPAFCFARPVVLMYRPVFSSRPLSSCID